MTTRATLETTSECLPACLPSRLLNRAAACFDVLSPTRPPWLTDLVRPILLLLYSYNLPNKVAYDWEPGHARAKKWRRELPVKRRHMRYLEEQHEPPRKALVEAYKHDNAQDRLLAD